MTHFNLFWSDIWLITLIVLCLKCMEINPTKTCSADIKHPDFIEKVPEWIDDKGLLKFHIEDSIPEKCESCPLRDHVMTIEEREICYTADDIDNRSLESICNWSHQTFQKTVPSKISLFPVIGRLKVLSLTKYKIETRVNIDETFTDLTDLEYLYLENNHITGISGNTSQLRNLKVLSLARNPIANLSKDSFTWLQYSNLEFLNLKGCSKIKILDDSVFKPLTNSGNLWIDLSYTMFETSQLANITAGFKNEKHGLKVLSLAHSGLYSIPPKALENIAHSLEKISLQGNYFSSYWSPSIDGFGDTNDSLFPTMKKLREMNLRDSGLIDFSFEVVLSFAENLEILYLDSNPLQEMTNSKPSKISYVSLRNIRRENGFSICFKSRCVFPKLHTLDLTDTLINVSLTTFSDLSSLKNLSLRNSLTEDLGNLLQPLKNLKFLDMSYNDMNFSLLQNTVQGLENLEILLLQSSSIYITSTSTQFLDLKNLKILDLRNNFITTLQKSFFTKLENLEQLILCDNKIGAWKDEIFINVKSLQVVYLQSNWLKDISSSMMLDFRKTAKIDMSNNPFSCNSSKVARFFEKCKYIENTENCQSTELNVIVLNWNNTKQYTCLTEEGEKLLAELHSDDENTNSPNPPTTTDAIISTSTTTTGITSMTTSESHESTIYEIETTTDEATIDETTTENSPTTEKTPNKYYLFIWIFVAIVPIGGVLCLWKRWNIFMCLRTFKKKMVFVLLRDTSHKKGKTEFYQYDVFLSYSDHDREWILQQLIPNLEQRAHIKVCLHERDFEAGLPVLENISSCMDRSRCVLLILSEAFLKSQWCQFELSLAQHRLVDMQHDRLILVLLEKIPRGKCSKMLRYLMLTKTYLFWPAQGLDEEKSFFWRKLKKAIGPVQNTMNVSFV